MFLPYSIHFIFDYYSIARMLPEVAVAVFCLKAVRYCMYMWLPMYLLNYVSSFSFFISILLSLMCNKCSEKLDLYFYFAIFNMQ